jgi:tRNA threonylcarbamoyladenosine biosynthesis protein TsaE
MQTRIIAENEEQMHALGKCIGQNLRGGEKIALICNLGAGKTTLAKAVLEGAGIEKKGSSPTFILDAVYKVEKDNLSEIHHLDLYRLKDKSELLTLGLMDLLNEKDVAVLVEWADRFDFLPADDYLEVAITTNNPGRCLIFTSHGQAHHHIIEAVSAA